MDIGINKKVTGFILFLTMGFFILGLGLILLTWQNLRQQQEHMFKQLEITGMAIIRSVEANLFRGVFRGSGPGRRVEQGEVFDMARDVLQEMVAESDVVFLDFSGGKTRLFISRHEDAAQFFEPSDVMIEKAMTGVWTEATNFMGTDVFILGIPASRINYLSRSRHSISGTLHGSDRQAVVFIALDMSSYLDVYSGFRQTIIMQTVFILGAILLLWFFLLAYFRRREQGEKLIQLKTFHSRLLDNMPDGLLSVDHNQMITAANPAVRDILGAGESIVGKQFSKVMPGRIDMESGSGWSQVELDDKSLEILFLPMKEESQSLVLVRDRTKMKDLERDLEHSRDLASMGSLAAGLAHEVRNPLSSLKGFAQFFLQKFDRDDPAHSYARTMVLESDRLNRVVTNLLYLARPRSLDMSKVNVKELFHEVVTLLGSDLNAKNCEVIIDVGAKIVVADRDHLKQALINLVLNSLSAIEDRGMITLSSKENMDSVEIVVADNGRGMTAEVQKRAVEPFFSARDGGTGLGLAIVQRTVRDHGGKIEIDSLPGRGTRVRLIFQIVQGEDADEN